jgi:malonyl-CoA/methylmalonyl-CoA synthetase
MQTTEHTTDLISRAQEHGDRIAIVEGDRQISYRELLDRSARIAAGLLDNRADLDEQRVAMLFPAGIDYASAQWGIWRAGGIAVPLNLGATLPEIEHVLTTAQVSNLVTAAPYRDKVQTLCAQLGIRVLDLAEMNSPSTPALPRLTADRRAMILFTSGTTSKPKGVVSTHGGIAAQIRSLVNAWGWRQDDRIPLFLPMHHIHGIVNIQSCALWCGARVRTFPAFDMQSILPRVAAREFTLFMAVPTIYVKLIEGINALGPDARKPVCEGFAGMRLMVSGSAALPVEIHRTWEGLTGQTLLERYGMTEIGMALSNPLQGERRPGAVGMPLPEVEIRLVTEQGEVIQAEDVPGEIQVRGPAVFKEYWNDPNATAKSFVDGWFRTGDMAVIERGYYRIMGRLSVDIIKSGGYKLSALEIEDALLRHPGIAECAVVGVPDDTWGEAVAVAVVPKAGHSLELEALRDWAGERMSRYKLPKLLQVVPKLPRNAMGKVTKPEVRRLFEI